METLLYIYITLLGLLFGSFGSVLIYRLKYKEPGILMGRSHCKCGKKLTSIDLIPLLWWILQKWKCNSCQSRISPIYPLLELATATMFFITSYFLVDLSLILQWNISEMITWLVWLGIGYITILYSFYDIAFMEIHDGIMWVGIWFVVLLLGMTGVTSWYDMLWIACVLALLIWCYIIMFKWLHAVWDIALLWVIAWIIWFSYSLLPGNIFVSGSIGALIMFVFFFVQILVSWWAWMGWWDLRIALMVGLVLGTSLVGPGLFFTYLAGSIMSLSIMAGEKLFCRGNIYFSSKIPFGPFIAIGCYITLLFESHITTLISVYL